MTTFPELRSAEQVADLVPAAVVAVLDLAHSWLDWDGRPVVTDGSVWTPNKAMRRVEDHLLDHLAELEAVLSGVASVPDTWHGRRATLDGDWARFTELELDEARSRLTRYAQLYRLRISCLTPEELDSDRNGSWTVRRIVSHVSGIDYYARCMTPSRRS